MSSTLIKQLLVESEKEKKPHKYPNLDKKKKRKYIKIRRILLESSKSLEYAADPWKMEEEPLLLNSKMYNKIIGEKRAEVFNKLALRGF